MLYKVAALFFVVAAGLFALRSGEQDPDSLMAVLSLCIAVLALAEGWRKDSGG